MHIEHLHGGKFVEHGSRREARRERRDAAADLEIVCLTGADITEEHWDAFYQFYMDTGARKWGRPARE